MNDILIDACRWHVDSEEQLYKQRALEHFRDRYNVLLAFLRTEGLLAEPSLGVAVADWVPFEFRASHLTSLGFELVKTCHGRWNPSFGQAHTQRHLVQWRRRLKALRTSQS
jgi:hypothetical protein